MIENNVRPVHRIAIYEAVKAAGSFAWDENASDRAKRLLRIIPQDRQSITANTIWPDYRLQRLQPSVVEGPDTQVAPCFCARDDMSVEDALKKQ